MACSRASSMSMRRTVLPCRRSVRQRSRIREREKTALPAPMMAIVGATFTPLLWLRTLMCSTGKRFAVAAEDTHPNRHPEGTRPCAQGEGLRMRDVVPQTARITQHPYHYL